MTRKDLRRTYPVHKRLMLHPLSLFVFLCTGVLMAGYTYHVVAATIISSTIQAPALTKGATVSAPASSTTFSSPTLNVSGSCPPSSYVTLNVNGAFNGVGLCGSQQTYDIAGSLYAGTNTLTVQAYNQTDQKGPSTDSVQVAYTPPAQTKADLATPSPAAAAATGDAPLLLTSDFNFHTFTTEKAFDWTLDLEGGTPPYNVHVEWGDGTTSDFRFPGDPVFNIHHQFKDSGYYPVVVHSVDAAGQKHIMQLAALITGSDGRASFLAPTAGSSSGSGTLAGKSMGRTGSVVVSHATTVKWLLIAWPFYIIVALMTVSFWLGERREYELIRPVRRARSARA